MVRARHFRVTGTVQGEFYRASHQRRYQLGPSFAIYEPGFLRTVLAFDKKGRVPEGAMLKFYFSTEQGL